MKASEFKELVQVLNLFANVRETAKPPESLIGVQVNGGVAKLIAGSGPAGTVVTLEGETPGKFAYTVDARPFLQSAKVISGKQEVTLEVTEQGLTIVTSEGGRVTLKAEGRLLDAGFPKKPKMFVVRSHVRGAAFKQLAKVFDTIHGDYEIEAPSLEQVEGTSHFVCIEPVKEKRAMYAHFETTGEDLEPDAKMGYAVAGYPAFWRSLKHLEADGLIEWGEDGVMALSGPYAIYSTPYRVSPYDPKTRRSEPPRNPAPWPIMALKGEPSVLLTIEKKPLIEAIKGVTPYDEHNRVTLSVRAGGVEVSAFGQEKGMFVPADTKNEGHRSVNSDYLLKLLRAMDGKSVTIGWAQQPAMILSAPEMEGWTILLAPVAMLGG